MENNFYEHEPYYNSYLKEIYKLKREFSFVSINVIGNSALYRDIHSLSIGNPYKSILIIGAFHAQEWLTCSLILLYARRVFVSYKEKLLMGNVNVNEALKERGIIFVPMANPDGVSIALEGAYTAGWLFDNVKKIMAQSNKSWQANARGVDLNHNFDAGFLKLHQKERESGITKPSPRQYGGAYPHSEPETQAIVRLLHQKYVENLYCFHSQGEEIFYEYGENTPEKSLIMATALSNASGYTLVKNDGLYSHGGCKDYFIDKFHRPGFTIEISKGENPLPICDLEGIFEKLMPMFSLMMIL